jgi:hypothetical protein
MVEFGGDGLHPARIARPIEQNDTGRAATEHRLRERVNNKDPHH